MFQTPPGSGTTSPVRVNTPVHRTSRRIRGLPPEADPTVHPSMMSTSVQTTLTVREELQKAATPPLPTVSSIASIVKDELHHVLRDPEATIRVLKDIKLNRVEAFNAVALADSVALVWEKYFESRILRHAYSPVAAHQLLYKQLLSRMPKDAAEAIQVQALGEKCPPRIFFEPFQEEEPSSSARTTEGTSAQQEEPDELQPMQGTSTHEATHVAPVLSVPDAAQLAQAQEHAYEFLEFQLRRVHSMNAHYPAYLDIVKGLGEELARVQNSSNGTGLMLALKATAAARRRRARHIRVQPTSPARRRPGLTRGSKRVPTGCPAVEPAAKRAKKRPHSLSHNIEKNVPGARLH
ncbi:hypothetical protein HPB51_005036 [Rhipicephalus microplus]|uniref:Uncharacterized protein n=1 Tax=Rhipicephalus microplus TaxID=6941 RepID=A0A9J6E725_RHIMP|nr:hypothetical protein HPB51_005036 [Rhipicephalus microplus]